ncbi:MAG: hypothetical protein O2979_07155 [Proteobacteria bacterium]|nr:hypothetical protein [Pseudomonadota bacterium]
MRTPAGYRKAMQSEGLRGEGWERAARFCSVQTAPVLAAACKSGVGGREYTVVMKTEYAPVCSKHSNLLAKGPCGGGRSYTVVKSGGEGWDTKCGERPAGALAKPAAPSAAGALKEGTRALKRLFGN